MDFQAVVMAAGKGSRMTEITAKCPKALLPIGNRPMIWYPLNLLQKNGFKDAIIVIPASHKSKIMEALNRLKDIELKISEELIQNNDLDSGTADALSQVIKSREIKCNLLVLSCDLIADVSLDPLLAVHYTYNPTLTLLFAPLPTDLRSVTVPGRIAKQNVEKDLVGLDSSSKRLVFMTSEADCDDEHLTLKRHVLHKYPNFTIYSSLLDAHAYVFNKSVSNILEEERCKRWNSLKGDLIPMLAQRQFSRKQNTSDTINYVNQMSSSMKMVHNKGSPVISCYSYITNEGFCYRANNLATYMQANHQMARLWPSLSSDKESKLIHPEVQRAEGAVIAPDCFVGERTVVGTGSILKGSTIGQDCKIGPDVKITNCVIMNKVTIRGSCNLQGCIVQRKATVEEGCQLKNFIVAVDRVAANTKSSNEVMMDGDQLMDWD